MSDTVREAQARALGLLLAGYSPEEVEALLEAEATEPNAYTALTDPTNVLMQEVTDDGTRTG